MSTQVIEKTKITEKKLNLPEPDLLTPKRVKRKNRSNKRYLTIALTSGTLLVLLIFLMPLAYGFITSLKTEKWISAPGVPVLPSVPEEYAYQSKTYRVYLYEDQKVILLKKGRSSSTLLNTETGEEFTWEGRWRTLNPSWEFKLRWKNFYEAWSLMDFPKLLLNTLFYTVLSSFGMILSSALVAFGFARFRFPGSKVAFIIVIATMILPPSVTLIPTYTFFYKIGLVGTWLPLILPCFFANAYNVFLLRQFFMGIPRSLDEAAMIDGAGYFTIFFRIILPQAVPALTAVGLFHFFYCWNDFFGPLLYLAGQPEKFPISLGLSNFVNMYKEKATLVQAGSLISTVIPLLLFIFCQRFFMQGVVVTGDEK